MGREASALANAIPEESGDFRFLRAACLATIKGSMWLILPKTSAMWTSTWPCIILPRFIETYTTFSTFPCLFSSAFCRSRHDSGASLANQQPHAPLLNKQSLTSLPPLPHPRIYTSKSSTSLCSTSLCSTSLSSTSLCSTSLCSTSLCFPTLSFGIVPSIIISLI
jgi:hypothetical protein